LVTKLRRKKENKIQPIFRQELGFVSVKNRIKIGE
jgi:hypothetical protein